MLSIFIQAIINGLASGSLIGLIAVGYSLVFGALKWVNFAHGDLYMFGAFLMFALAKFHFGIAIAMAMLATGILSACIYQWIYRPCSVKNSLFLSSIAVSLLLESILQIFFSGEAQLFPFEHSGDLITLFDTIYLRTLDLWTFGSCLVITWALKLFLQKSLWGLGIRAIADSHPTATALGLPVQKIIALTFFLGGAAAAFAAGLQSLQQGQINALMGISAGIKAFSAAIFGGVGSLWGAFLGGCFLGLLESGLMEMGLSAWKDSLSYFLLILFLILRPQGIFGSIKVIKL